MNKYISDGLINGIQNYGSTAFNAEFRESDHPRAKDGKFGTGGGKGKSEKKEKYAETSYHKKLRISHEKRVKTAYGLRDKMQKAKDKSGADSQGYVDAWKKYHGFLEDWRMSEQLLEKEAAKLKLKK